MGLPGRPLWSHMLAHKWGKPSAAALSIRSWLRVWSCSGQQLECQGHSRLGLPAAPGPSLPCIGLAGDADTHSCPQRLLVLGWRWKGGVARCYHLVLFSSSCEFGAALESAGEEEVGEEVSASQAAVQTVATEEAVRRYIRSQPALYRKVLLYQPLELAELQAELKQQGIRVASGKLLDFLDTQCITFTTATTRKEKLGRKRRQPTGKKRGRAGRPAPRSPVSAASSL